MASLIDHDSWLMAFEGAEGLFAKAYVLRSRIERAFGDGEDSNRLIIPSSEYKKIREELRLNLSQLSGELTELSKGLEAESSTTNLTQGEKDRRANLLRSLILRGKQIRDEILMRDSELREGDRQRLFQSSNSSGMYRSTSSTSNYQQQTQRRPHQPERSESEFDQILTEQDENLDALHEVIVRQKRLASTIGTEVGTQNELIDDIGDGIDRTRERLINTTDNVREVGRTDRTCGYWITITVLLIIIIILIALPGRS